MTAALAFLSGISLKTWLRIAGAAAVLAFVWMAYSWAWERGAASQAATDQIKIDALADNVLRLATGIKDANARIEIEQAKARALEAEAAAIAQKGLAKAEASRRRERSRGAGANHMNEFFGEMFK